MNEPERKEAARASVVAQFACLEGARQAPQLSVVVKCYNEQDRIAACLDSILAATRERDAEIIVADALSSDGTVDIARRYPVRIVQMVHPEDRGCGATAQMGQQFARGELLLLIDSDMELLPDFLPHALTAMVDDPRLACVGGLHVQMSSAVEFQDRLRGLAKYTKPTAAKRLGGSALYRTAAIRDVGYFMNRNLYCSEELELGQRLRARGWRLKYLPINAVKHYGYEISTVTLLRRRWKSRYLDGYGQLLRRSWSGPFFRETLGVCRVHLLVIAWWCVLAALTFADVIGISGFLPLSAVALLPVIAIGVRKRNLERASYTFLLWQFQAAALVRGLSRRQRDPAEPVRSVIIA
jgi:cellulose synthase/poly-beta-1,6-N-acetylglucosamine synthase-like glycosyltransferase